MTELITKSDYRREARRRRAAMPDRESASARLLALLTELPEYRAANRIFCYVGCGDEVATLPALHEGLATGKSIVVPLCLQNELQLFELRSLDDLAPRTLGILEPREELWTHSERFVDIQSIDLAVIPGVAFGQDGSRIGQGRGYYDRLLARSPPGRPFRLAIAFECQLFPTVPAAQHDAPMDALLTEERIYRIERGGPHSISGSATICSASERHSSGPPDMP